MFAKRKSSYFLIFTYLFLLPLPGLRVLAEELPARQIAPQLLSQTENPKQTEAKRLYQQGLEQVNANQFEAALPSFQQALTIYREIGDRKGEWDALFGLGLAYSGTGNKAKAVDTYQQTLNIAQTIKNRQLEWQSLNALGTIYAAVNEITKAIEYHQQSLVLAREIKDSLKEWFSLNALGGVYLNLGETGKAIEYYQQGLTLSRSTPRSFGEEISLRNLRQACSALAGDTKARYEQQCLAVTQQAGENQASQAAGENPEERALQSLKEGQQLLLQKTKESLPQAIAKFEEALSIVRSSGNSSFKQLEAIALIGIGSAYDSLGEKQKAIDYFNQVLSLSPTLGNRQIEANAKSSIAAVYSDLSQYQQALEYYNQVLPIYREIDDRLGQAIILDRIGQVYYERGEYQQALQFYNQSLPISQDLGDPTRVAIVLGDIGLVHSALGEYQKALDYYNQALPSLQKGNDRTNQAAIFDNIGTVYFFLGQPQKALTYFNQALTLEEELGDRSKVATTLVNIATVYSNLGQNQKALDSYDRGLSIVQSLGDKAKEATFQSNIGAVYFDLGQNQKAIEFYERAISLAREVGNRLEEASTLGKLGQVYYDLQEYPKATEYLQQSLKIVREIGDRRIEGMLLNHLGRVQFATGKFAEAEKTFLDGIKVWESIRAALGSNDINKISIFEEQAVTYRLAQKALIAQNKTDAALEISERGRARAFVELLAGRITAQSAQANILPPTIADIKKVAKEQNATIIEYSIIYDDLKIRQQANAYEISPDQLRPQPHESELLIWAIKPTGEIAFRKVDLKSINANRGRLPRFQDLVSSSRTQLGVRGRGIAIAARVDENRQSLPTGKPLPELQQLHQILIQPIADLLPKNANDRVIFIPQCELFLVPFAALQDNSGKYLIEQHTIITAPAIQVLDLTHKQRNKTQNLNADMQTAVVVGNPTMPKIGNPPQQLPSLPGAEQEAKDIAALLNTQPLIGKDATKAAILQKLPQAKLIHFATHGLLDDFQGLGVPGAVALSPSSQDNGLLTASEILDLKLNAELVVLSACDTGRGRLTGDGVIGLSRSLIVAGVKSAIVSLWSVPDAPTASLMTDFYRNLQQNPDKAQALRNAMLNAIKKYPNPRDWAAFTLIGEAE
ncbi:tetratricopeptide repeat protein [Aerosakkonema funiforme]|uniref:tetratricopeptide repeat protein n=1 Tax=Aerosakkonema funiforme TaxID=1246630 RepID=UPI0035B8B7CC